MTDSDDVVRSNVLFGAINAILVISSYLAVIFIAHVFLREIHGIDMLTYLEKFSNLSIPVIAEMFSYLRFLFESLIIHTIILSLIYAAYISNYEVKLGKDNLRVKKGFLLIDIHEFTLDNIQTVYTEKYTFFHKTKQLCIKALDEEVIKIPYVPNADEFKNKLVDEIKSHNAHVQTSEELKVPVTSAAPNPQ